MPDADSTRAFRIRKALGLSQPEFAERLGVSQSTISRLELGQPETGPISRLLDFLVADPTRFTEMKADAPAEPAEASDGVTSSNVSSGPRGKDPAFSTGGAR